MSACQVLTSPEFRLVVLIPMFILGFFAICYVIMRYMENRVNRENERS
jgi:hypothetical protein